MKKPVLTLMLIAILIIIVSSGVVYARELNEFRNWLITLVATIIGALFAIATGIAIFYQQERATADTRKKQLCLLLEAELSDTIRILSSGEFLTIHFSKSEKKEVLVAYIQPLILEDAAKSGLFNSQHTENMLHLARKMRMYNTKVSYFLSVISAGSSNPNFEQLALNAIKNIEDTRKAIIEGSNLLLTQMNLRLSPSLKYE